VVRTSVGGTFVHSTQDRPQVHARSMAQFDIAEEGGMFSMGATLDKF